MLKQQLKGFKTEIKDLSEVDLTVAQAIIITQLSKFIKETLAYIDTIWPGIKEYYLIKRLFPLIVARHCNRLSPLNKPIKKLKGKMRQTEERLIIKLYIKTS